MLTPKQEDLLRRHVSIDGDGNVVGKDSQTSVVKKAAGAYAIQIGEQEFTVHRADLHRVLRVENSEVGVIGDHAHIESGIKFGK